MNFAFSLFSLVFPVRSIYQPEINKQINTTMYKRIQITSVPSNTHSLDRSQNDLFKK